MNHNLYSEYVYTVINMYSDMYEKPSVNTVLQLGLWVYAISLDPWGVEFQVIDFWMFEKYRKSYGI